MRPLRFVRFVTARLDEDSGRRTGPFIAMGRLKRGAHLSKAELDYWDEVRGWFDKNLKEPDRLSRSLHPRAQNKAIAWFKDTATEHIGRMHEIVELLREHGIEVDLLRTERPGFIVYEDQFQIAAEPFADTPT
ncbi:MAG: hypothetical protein ABIO40_07310 [Devosia sp.]